MQRGAGNDGISSVSYTHLDVYKRQAHSQIGDVYEKLDVQQEGADLNIAFNVKYLTDVVRFSDAEQIEINLNNAISSCVITPLGDPDYVHLVLPVRTGATA